MSTSANAVDLEIQSITEKNEALVAELTHEVTSFSTKLTDIRDRKASLGVQLAKVRDALLEIQRPLQKEYDDITARLFNRAKGQLVADKSLPARLVEVQDLLEKNIEQVEKLNETDQKLLIDEEDVANLLFPSRKSDFDLNNKVRYYAVQESSQDSGPDASGRPGTTALAATTAPQSVLADEEITSTTVQPAKSAPSPQYGAKNMSSKVYPHIILYKGKATELNCPICGTNSMAGGTYFDGTKAFVEHIRQFHPEANLRTEQETLEAAAANGSLRDVDEADFNLIAAGLQPENVRPPDRALNHKLSKSGPQDGQFEDHDDSIHPVSNNFSYSTKGNSTKATFSSFSVDEEAKDATFVDSGAFQTPAKATSLSSRPRRSIQKRKADDGSLYGTEALNALSQHDDDELRDTNTKKAEVGKEKKRRKKTVTGDDEWK